MTIPGIIAYSSKAAPRARVGAGRGAVTARDGDFLFIPAHMIHRESNPNDSEAVVVVCRASDGELMVSVEGPAPA